MALSIELPRFRDIANRERKAFDWHVYKVEQLTEVQKKRALSTSEAEQLDRSKGVVKEINESSKRNKAIEVCDPVFVGARTLLNKGALLSAELRSHKSGSGKANERKIVDGQLIFEAEKDRVLPTAFVALTIGILFVDEATAPPVMLVPQARGETGSRHDPTSGDEPSGRTIYSDLSHKSAPDFTKQFFAAVGEARSYERLADTVLQLLSNEGDPDGENRTGYRPTVDAREFARVMRELAERKIGSDEPQLRRRVNEVLNKVQNVGSESDVAESNIDLPDLEDIADQNIIAENVRVMGPMIVSAMFEELKVFQVVDRIVEQFQHGMLPIGPGDAGKMLYQYWRETPNRMSEQERRSFAAITLGIPGGNDEGLVNREFNDLWIRFVSSVSSFVRQFEVDSLLRSATPSAISHQQVRKAARDLAGNLSLHGYGMAHYAAREVQSQINFMIKLLSDREIKGSYGARDMWQVVDQVATYELGGAKTSSRYRTLATSGTIITAWLANNVAKINQTTGPVIDINIVRNPEMEHGSNHKATRNPSDYDLVNACELWLADTATSDSQVEELSQPREAPVMTSKPIPIPSMAQDILDGIGPIGLGNGMATHH